MHFQYLPCLLLVGLAYGQAAQPATPPAAGAKAEPSASAAPNKAPEVEAGPDDPVITLKGVCAGSTQQGDACKTVITRAQFEKLVEAMQPGMPLAMRRNLANSYARALKMSAEAEKRGLDKGPIFDEKMALARISILSQELNSALREDANKVTDGDIEDYYKKNPSSFEQATFARIFIPRAKQIPPSVVTPKAGAKANTGTKTAANQPPTAAQQKAAEEAMTEVADELRARVVKGEDPDKLQKEAYAAAGLTGNPPTTKMEGVRGGALPANHRAVMDLKPGEVSKVISDPNGPHYIYKLVAKETLALDAVKPEIRNLISSQRYRDSVQGFQREIDLNDAYFGPSRNPAMPSPPRGAKPPAQQAEDPD